MYARSGVLMAANDGTAIINPPAHGTAALAKFCGALGSIALLNQSPIGSVSVTDTGAAWQVRTGEAVGGVVARAQPRGRVKDRVARLENVLKIYE